LDTKKLLVIGSGGCGCRLAELFSKEYKVKKVLFNTAETDVECNDVILLKDSNGKSFGSGRNPLVTLNEIAPINEELLKESIEKAISFDVERIITFSSTGGGTGLPLISYITNNILKNKNIPINSILIAPFKSEGNPQNSNSIRMITKFIEKCGKYVSPLLLQNDWIHTRGDKSTFDNTNKSIVEFIYKIFDYKHFIGTIKEGSISTLDENEFNRIMEPTMGFMSVDIVKLSDFNEESLCKYYNLNSAKKMIILFQTRDPLPIEYVEKIHEMFPSPIKIISESKGKDIIKILSNGLDLPVNFNASINAVLKNIKQYKQNTKTSKVRFKKQTKKISDTLFKL
jgi:cell division GTPase FtsZ